MKQVSRFITASAFVITVSGMPAQAAEFGLFGDVLLSASSDSEENSSFALGALDFYGTAEIGENTRAFVEYVFEDAGDGLITDLERLWITRTFSDLISVGVGRFHSPLGKWNRTYHHGALLQDTVTRPFFLDFEDGEAAILPTHIVGMLASGTGYFSSGSLAYEAYVSNGPSIDTSAGFNPPAELKPEIDINVSSDPDNKKSVGFRTSFTPESLPLTVSAMYMSNTVAESAETGGVGGQRGNPLVEQGIFGVDAFYEGDRFDLLFEYYNLKDDNKVGVSGSYTGTAWFAQLGYRITEKLKAVYRYADLSFDKKDSYFSLLGVSESSRQVVALRYDLDDTNALKMEVNQNDPAGSGVDGTTSYIMQWAFLIP